MSVDILKGPKTIVIIAQIDYEGKRSLYSSIQCALLQACQMFG